MNLSPSRISLLHESLSPSPSLSWILYSVSWRRNLMCLFSLFMNLSFFSFFTYSAKSPSLFLLHESLSLSWIIPSRISLPHESLSLTNPSPSQIPLFKESPSLMYPSPSRTSISLTNLPPSLLPQHSFSPFIFTTTIPELYPKGTALAPLTKATHRTLSLSPKQILPSCQMAL